MYLFSNTAFTNCPQFNSLKENKFILSQFSQFRSLVGQTLLRVSQEQNQSVDRSEFLSGDSSAQSIPRLVQVVGRMHSPVVVGIRTVFFFFCSLLFKNYSQLLETSLIPWFMALFKASRTSQVVLIPGISLIHFHMPHLSDQSLGCSQGQIFHTKSTVDYIEPIRIIQDNLSSSEYVTLITSAKFLLPGNITYSQA